MNHSIRMMEVTVAAKRVVLFLALVFLLTVMAGCPAAMTTSQATQVNKFASTAEAYGPLPGEVLRAYADQRWLLDMADVSIMKTKELSIARYTSAVKAKQAAMLSADRADQALAVLNTYASLLKTLTASDYSEAVGKEAERFGKTIDEGIDSYNTTGSRKNISKFGGYIAAAFRGVGGVYIRYQQGEALKLAVTKAQDGVNELLDATMTLIRPYSLADYHPQALRDDLQSSRDLLRANWSPANGPIPMERLLWFDVQSTRIDEGEQLAQRAYRAAARYKEAHEQLVKAIDVKEDLPEIIGRVEAFAADVQAALALKKKMENGN